MLFSNINFSSEQPCTSFVSHISIDQFDYHLVSIFEARTRKHGEAVAEVHRTGHFNRIGACRHHHQGGRSASSIYQKLVLYGDAEEW